MKKIAALSLLAIATALAQQPKFEIADVHASTTKRGYVQNFGGVLRDGKYIFRDATMLNLIGSAYSVTEDLIAGGPNWVDLDLFDVIAKVPAGITAADANLMLQALLAERFGLVVRKEMRPAPRYVLSVGKGGSKLKPAAPAADSGCKQTLTGAGGNSGPDDPNFLPNIKVTCHNFTAQAIADNLRQMASAYLTHDVVDQTKLEGAWDLELEWTPYQILSHKGDNIRDMPLFGRLRLGWRDRLGLSSCPRTHRFQFKFSLRTHRSWFNVYPDLRYWIRVKGWIDLAGCVKPARCQFVDNRSG